MFEGVGELLEGFVDGEGFLLLLNIVEGDVVGGEVGKNGRYFWCFVFWSGDE